MQEADVGSHWNHTINTVERIRRTAGYDHAVEGVHNRRQGRKPLAYGNAILSRYPVHFSETIPFGTSELGEKGFMIVSVEAQGLIHTVINLHLDFKSRGKRIEQIETILEKIESAGLPGHPVICGDFNSSSKAEMDAVCHLLAFMQSYDDYTLCPNEGRTFPAHFPLKGFDFILVPSRYRVKECSIVKSYLSDHRPVIVALEFTV